MISLAKSDFENLPLFQKSIRIAPDGTLYKASREIIDSKKLEYFHYINSIKPIKGLLLPIDLIKDKEIYGYQMTFIEDGQNIDELLTQPIDLDILTIIKQIFIILEQIHNYIILGDIRNANILITKLEVYFIDWDAGKKKNSSSFLTTFYKIICCKNILDDNALSDTFKAFISSLSLLYGLNIEKFIIHKDMTTLLKILNAINADPNIIYYLEDLINQANNQQTTPNFSFAELVDYVSIPSKKEKEKLTRILSR